MCNKNKKGLVMGEKIRILSVNALKKSSEGEFLEFTKT